MKEEKEKNNFTSSTAGFVLAYGKADDIKINLSDLKLEMIDFKKAVKSEISLSEFLVFISIWTTLFVSDFKSFFIISGGIIRTAYIVIAIFLSFFILRSFLISIKKICVKPFLKFRDFLYEYESNPQKKAEMIISKCKKQYIIKDESIGRTYQLQKEFDKNIEKDKT